MTFVCRQTLCTTLLLIAANFGYACFAPSETEPTVETQWNDIAWSLSDYASLLNDSSASLSDDFASQLNGSVPLFNDCVFANKTKLKEFHDRVVSRKNALAEASNAQLLENTNVVTTYYYPEDSAQPDRYVVLDKVERKNLTIALLYGAGDVEQINRFTYLVDCGPADHYPPGMTCNMFRELVRYTISYAFSWINLYNQRRDGQTLPRIRVVEARSRTDQNYMKQRTLEIRMSELKNRLLGLANYKSMQINYKEKWYYDEIDVYHQPLLVRAGSRFRKMLNIYRPRMFPGRQTPCANGFLTTLLHELLHSLRLEHSNQFGGLMAPYALSRRHGLSGNSQFGFYISPTELMALRTRWHRNNKHHPVMMLNDFLQEFQRTMLDTERYANYEELAAPTAPPKTTTTAKPRDPPVVVRPPIIIKINTTDRTVPADTRVLGSKDQYLFGRTFSKLSDMLKFAKLFA